MTYYWAVKYKKKYTPYSDEFETRLDAMRWYRDYGKRLSKTETHQTVYLLWMDEQK